MKINIDISSNRDLYFLTMVGWENRDKDAHLTSHPKTKFLSPDPYSQGRFVARSGHSPRYGKSKIP